MKYPILFACLLLAAFPVPDVSAATTTTLATKMIASPGQYIVRNAANVTFFGEAKFGTPCFSPPYYTYEWYLNDSFIGSGQKLMRKSTDFRKGKYTLLLNVTDCVGRTAGESAELYVVDPLEARIEGIDSGGKATAKSNCMLLACNVSACTPAGELSAGDTYGVEKTYAYNRTTSPAGNTLRLTYDGSLSYEITDPKVEVIWPNKCVSSEPYGFFTYLMERSTQEYYFLIGEDDFIGGLENVQPPFCRNICQAFMKDFIPIVSQSVMCGAATIDDPRREGTTLNGYTEVIATSPDNTKKIHFIFADDMTSFLKGRWSYTGLGVNTGVATQSMADLCTIFRPHEYSIDKCLLNLKGTAWGGLPPYDVKWVSEGDGTIDEYYIAEEHGTYELVTTPPMSPPLSAGLHNISFYATDQLGLTAKDTWTEIKIPPCCAVSSPCTKYWPGREGPAVNTGNEVSYACDIYEVCRPELWARAREASYCCKENCPTGCHGFCQEAYDYGAELSPPNSTILSADGMKKCIGLYLINGFGPAKKYMQDYFWPEICCSGDSYCLEGGEEGCCQQDMITCSCAWHAYSREAQSLPCVGAVATSPSGWRNDVAMNQNSCTFSDLGAYASIEVLRTGTCVDYGNSLTTMLRIAGYGPDEVYAATGPSHQYVLVKFPQSPKWNIIETTGNWETPYTPFGISGYPGFPYCSYFACRNDAGMANCPTNVWGC